MLWYRIRKFLNFIVILTIGFVIGLISSKFIFKDSESKPGDNTTTTTASTTKTDNDGDDDDDDGKLEALFTDGIWNDKASKSEGKMVDSNNIKVTFNGEKHSLLVKYYSDTTTANSSCDSDCYLLTEDLYLDGTLLVGNVPVGSFANKADIKPSIKKFPMVDSDSVYKIQITQGLSILSDSKTNDEYLVIYFYSLSSGTLEKNEPFTTNVIIVNDEGTVISEGLNSFSKEKVGIYFTSKDIKDRPVVRTVNSENELFEKIDNGNNESSYHLAYYENKILIKKDSIYAISYDCNTVFEYKYIIKKGKLEVDDTKEYSSTLSKVIYENLKCR